MTNKIVALHGFLGKPTDWDCFSDLPLETVDLFDPRICHLGKGLKETAHHLNRLQKSLKLKDKQLLMGYSLGSRLALHMLIDDPNVWGGAVIISGHPGLDDEAKKAERKMDDMCWSSLFLDESWDRLMTAWNGQSCFRKGITFARKEADYNRQILAETLVGCSLGIQDNLLSQIAKLECPILWIVGENDADYVALAKKVILKHPLSQKWIVRKAGHRAAWDIPEEFQRGVIDFVKQMPEPKLESVSMPEVSKTQVKPKISLRDLIAHSTSKEMCSLTGTHADAIPNTNTFTKVVMGKNKVGVKEQSGTKKVSK